jgi:hypothetical protein
VVSSPASYSGGLVFKSSPRRMAILIESFCGLLQSPGRMPGQYLKISPRPLPTKSFPIQHHSLVTVSPTLYCLITEKRRKIKLPTNRYLGCSKKFAQAGGSTQHGGRPPVSLPYCSFNIRMLIASLHIFKPRDNNCFET